MSDFSKTYENVLKKYEGGYKPAPGETYRGIDRTQDPGKYWQGWPLIDAYKDAHGLKRYDIINDPIIEQSVIDFYQKKYLPNFFNPNPEAIQSQTLADLIIDFVVHKAYDAIRVINGTVLSVDNSIPVSKYKLTPEVIKQLNADPVKFYKFIRQNRIGYYKNPDQFGSVSYTQFSAANLKNFLARAYAFPTELPFTEANIFSMLFKKLIIF